MSTKMNKTSKAAIVRTKSLGDSPGVVKTHNVKFNNKEHIIEITLSKMRKGQKHTSPLTSFSPGQKTEKKRSASNDSESPRNWGETFRQQNVMYLKKKQSTPDENKETKKNTNEKRQKSTVKHPMKSDEKHPKSPYCSTTPLYNDTVLVQDCAVQYPEIYNSNKLAEFNPVYMLSLMKQLQDLVNRKDRKTCEIFTKIEQMLQKMPDLEIEVESNVVPLKESNEKIEAISYELLILERENLKSEILKRDEQLKEADKKYLDLAKMFTQQLDEVTHEKNNIISMVTDLRQEVKDNEKIIKNLRTDLEKQTELLHKNNIDNQYLTMEIDKLSALSSYKDAQIIDYRNTAKELQNQIATLKTINEIRMKEAITSPQLSLIYKGRACSSPLSSFSDDSYKSNLSNTSSADFVIEEHARCQKKDAPVKDFELVSLLDGESSLSMLPDQNKDNVTSKEPLRRSSKKDHNKENALEKNSKSTVFDIRKRGDIQNRNINVPSPLRDCPYPDWSDSSLPSISTVSNLDMMPSNDV